MTSEQKKAFMKSTVVPTMKVVFQELDATRHAQFGCKTCHGADGAKNDFKMPNPELPKLGPPGSHKGDPKVAKFMKERVMPTLAKTLGVSTFDPATHEGFGCLGCHTVEGHEGHEGK